jgi:photosystem II stability/assembly factor-like uncharacterized protein
METGDSFNNGWGAPAERRINAVLDQFTTTLSYAGVQAIPLPANTTQLRLTLNDNGFTVNRTGRLKDSPPNQLSGAYAYRARLLTAGGQVLGEFGFGDPRIIYAEAGYPGPVRLSEASFFVNLPYYYNARTLQIYDANGVLVKTIDITSLTSGGISGTVSDSQSRPVGGVRVELIGPDLATATTTANGQFSVQGIAAGSYVINVIPPGASNLIPTVSSVAVQNAQIITSNATLQLGASVQGRVLRGASSPVANAILYMSGYETPRYSTNSNGYYVMRGLPAGNYTLNLDSTKKYRIIVNGQFVSKGNAVNLMLQAGQGVTVDFIDVVLAYLPTFLRSTSFTWRSSTGLTGRIVYDIASTNASCSTLIAGADNGAYRSLDGGQTWAPLSVVSQAASLQRRPFDDQANPDSNLTPAVAICPADPNVVYLTRWGEGVYRSTDGGNSWQPRNGGLSDLWIYDLAVQPSDCNVVYAATNSTGVYKTSDGGGYWQARNSGLGNLMARSLAIALADPNRLYVGTANGVYRSDDAANWWRPTGWLPGVTTWALAVAAGDANTVYAGLDGYGVYKSTNGGSTWQPQNTGLGNVKARALIVDPLAAQAVYVGRDDGGGVCRSLDGAGSWSELNQGLGGRNVKALWLDGGSCRTLQAGTTNGSWYYGR